MRKLRLILGNPRLNELFDGGINQSLWRRKRLLFGHPLASKLFYDGINQSLWVLQPLDDHNPSGK